uniref:ubiquitin-conjugating enzyme E2 R2 isoform X1 n=1 Tax=Myodes glareolus TaxID=447135 RepID=UPI00202163B5|nr:ubiquitin-conjugating enzyme E2 R2 isoform X1 [Myodes glareolus]
MSPTSTTGRWPSSDPLTPSTKAATSREPGRIRLSGHNLFSMSSCKKRAKGSEAERDTFAWYQDLKKNQKARRGTAGERKPCIQGWSEAEPPETQLLVLNGRQSHQRTRKHFCCRLTVEQAHIKFPIDYPYSPPTFRFLTKMWHPNIYENGDVCISILHPPVDDPQSGELPSERWNPTQNVRTILLSVISLLNEPNTFSPANVDASVMFRKWRDSKGKDKEYAEIIRKQVSATKAEAEKDGVKVPTTLAEYCIKTKVPSNDNSSDLLYDDLYDDDIDDEDEEEEDADCYDDDDSGNEES